MGDREAKGIKAKEEHEFEEAHAVWLNGHLRKRKGERRDRLKRGHGHGEKLFLKKVWWPMFGSLDELHPEYEVSDWRGARCYLDFAWLRGDLRFNLDVKGYGPHVEQTDRTKYERELLREIQLQTYSFRNVAIPYDTVARDPQLLQQMIRQLLQSLERKPSETSLNLSTTELAILQFAQTQLKDVSPSQVAKAIGIHPSTARHYMKKLVEKGRLIALGKSTCVRRYQYFRDEFRF
ncbi:hypothetical protein NYE40_06780 [Paenibacillus sp. FSL W8-1187]|uniref:hypothetical protein n=1 Tax=Paenibacillus TaxID=44249 RepID=UPI0011AF1E79|nr:MULTISPECIES: hypothetical protein [Paenibacillus]QGG55300.1 hypothetical protein GE073_06695 [Paenibacillus sp. B01]